MQKLDGWTSAAGLFRAKSAAFAQALLDPKAAQLHLLAQLIRHNQETSFGREHGFGDIVDWPSYRARVPIRKYEDFTPYIARILAGESAVLASGPIEFVELTGGSSGGSKSIPFTRAGIDGFASALHPWMGDLIARRPGITRGRGYFALSPVGRTGRESAGAIRLGSGNNFTFFTNAQPYLDQVSLVSMTMSRLSDLEEWQFLTCLFLLAADDLSFVWVWSPTYLTTLVKAMKRDRTRLIRALAQGVDLPAPGGDDQRFVAAANPARARLAEQALTDGATDSARLWPRLDTISCWMDGSSKGFSAELRGLFPAAHFQPKGLVSTECAVSFPYGDEDAPILAVLSTLCEFVDEAGEARLLDQVEKGKQYRVIVSTQSGLYRYDTGDLVEIVGFTGLTPRLRFVGRGGLVSDLCGEKLTDEFVSRCILELPLRPGQCAFMAPNLDPTPHYTLFLDAMTDNSPTELGAALDRHLRRNPQYAYAQAIGQLAGLDVWPVADLFERYASFVLAGGRSIAGLKVPALAAGLGEAWLKALGARPSQTGPPSS